MDPHIGSLTLRLGVLGEELYLNSDLVVRWLLCLKNRVSRIMIFIFGSYSNLGKGLFYC